MILYSGSVTPVIAKEIRAEHALLPQTEREAAVGPLCNRLMDLCSRLRDTGDKLKSGDLPGKEAAKIEKTRRHGTKEHLQTNTSFQTC